MSENKKYKLYAQNITGQNVAKAESQRFCRITSEYILIYTYGRKPYGSVEITTGETKRLTAARLQCGSDYGADQRKAGRDCGRPFQKDENA